jgi:Ca2+/H+ antiporter
MDMSALLHSRLNLLLGVVPVTWVMAAFLPGSPWLFLVTALSIVPLAGLIGKATDQLASQSGPTLGGFLNATFGNAAELIIGIVAQDGESNWVEGLQLLAVYVIPGMAFYLIPARP